MKKLQTLVAIATAIVISTVNSDAAAQGKTYQGVYCLGYVQTGTTVKYNTPPWTAIWKDSFVSGVALRATWPSMEASKGGYDWSMIDGALAEAQANNKVVSLSVTPGVFAPSWLTNEGAKYINIATDASGSTRANMVLPWDPTFQKEWGAFVKAEGARYDANPNVGYVMIGGPGTAIETFMVHNQADYNTFAAAGGLPKWIIASEQIIDMYGAAFKNTPFNLALGNPVTNVPSENQAGQRALQQVVDYAMAKYPGRFGICSHALQSISLTQDSNYFVNQDIMQNSSTAPTGFQMISAATNSQNTTWSVGNLGTAATAGVQMGGQFEEVYLADCQNPQYTAMLTAANNQLNGY